MHKHTVPPPAQYLMFPFSETHCCMQEWCAQRCVPEHEHGIARFSGASSSCMGERHEQLSKVLYGGRFPEGKSLS